MTKPITVAAVLQQVEKNRINLLAPISDYLPGFTHLSVGHLDAENHIVIDRASIGVIRVYHLLCHTSGIGTFPLCQAQNPNTMTTAETADFYSSQVLAFDPFTSQSYSPTGAFDVAARLVEIVCGESFGDYVVSHICRPLGMCDTVFAPNASQWNRIVPMHDRDQNGNGTVFEMPKKRVYSNIPVTACCAGAGLITTAEDYNHFAEMLLNEGLGTNGSRILHEESVSRMRTPHVPEFLMPGAQRWGLGVRVITDKSYAHRLSVGCYGWSGAYGTHFWVDPENRITVILMRNSKFDGGSGSMISATLEEDISDCLE